MREALLEARRRAGKTQAAVAAAAGIDRISYLQIERSRTNPSLATAMRIAAYLGAPVEVLFAESPSPPEPAPAPASGE